MIPIRYKRTSDPALKAFASKLQSKIVNWVQWWYVGDAASHVLMDQHAHNFFESINKPDAIWKIIDLPANQLLNFISQMERDYPELATDRTNKDKNKASGVSVL